MITLDTIKEKLSPTVLPAPSDISAYVEFSAVELAKNASVDRVNADLAYDVFVTHGLACQPLDIQVSMFLEQCKDESNGMEKLSLEEKQMIAQLFCEPLYHRAGVDLSYGDVWEKRPEVQYLKVTLKKNT